MKVIAVLFLASLLLIAAGIWSGDRKREDRADESAVTVTPVVVATTPSPATAAKPRPKVTVATKTTWQKSDLWLIRGTVVSVSGDRVEVQCPNRSYGGLAGVNLGPRASGAASARLAELASGRSEQDKGQVMVTRSGRLQREYMNLENLAAGLVVVSDVPVGSILAGTTVKLAAVSGGRSGFSMAYELEADPNGSWKWESSGNSLEQKARR